MTTTINRRALQNLLWARERLEDEINNISDDSVDDLLKKVHLKGKMEGFDVAIGYVVAYDVAAYDD